VTPHTRKRYNEYFVLYASTSVMNWFALKNSALCISTKHDWINVKQKRYVKIYPSKLEITRVRWPPPIQPIKNLIQLKKVLFKSKASDLFNFSKNHVFYQPSGSLTLAARAKSLCAIHRGVYVRISLKSCYFGFRGRKGLIDSRD